MVAGSGLPGTERVAGRELDALVAEKVMGLTVLPLRMVAAFVEGEWSLHPESTVEGWACHSEEAPVYVSRCMCDLGPIQVPEDDPETNHLRHEHNETWQKEFDAEREKWGHTSRCLDVVPTYSTDIKAAWKVVEAMREHDFTFIIDNTSFVWCAGFSPLAAPDRIQWVANDSARLAICLAALSAVEAGQ